MYGASAFGLIVAGGRGISALWDSGFALESLGIFAGLVIAGCHLMMKAINPEWDPLND